MIRALEEELDAQLFVRSPRRVALTAVGEALVEPARDLVMQSERIIHLVRRVQRGETARLRLGFSGTSVSAAVSTLVREVRRLRPEVTIDLRGAQLSQPGFQRLISGSLDAVVGRWDTLPDEVDSLVIAQEQLMIALPTHHHLATAKSVSAADVAGEPWIVLPGGGGATLSNRLHKLAQRGGFIPRVVETAADSATQLLMVDAGTGIALTFSTVSENIPVHAVTFRPIEPSLGVVDIRLIWRRYDANPALTAIIDTARTIAEEINT